MVLVRVRLVWNVRHRRLRRVRRRTTFRVWGVVGCREGGVDNHLCLTNCPTLSAKVVSIFGCTDSHVSSVSTISCPNTSKPPTSIVTEFSVEFKNGVPHKHCHRIFCSQSTKNVYTCESFVS